MPDSSDRFALGQLTADEGPGFAALIVDSWFLPIADLVPGIDHVGDLLASWDSNVNLLRREAGPLRQSGRYAGRTPSQWRQLRVLAPLRPGQVFQSGANYRSHVIDLSVAKAREDDPDQDLDVVRADTAAMMDARAANDQPYVFIGLPAAICSAFDNVVLPATGVQHDWELELAAVIGSYTYQVPYNEAMAHVAGYTIVNDITTRDRVFRPDIPGIGTDWLAGKNAPTFLPTGPWVTPAAFVEDPMKLDVKLQLNGEFMQDESTADMIFDIARLIEHISQITPLNPGDLVLTGSPAGNGAHYGRYLREGDVMDGTVSGLGAQRNVCVAAKP